MISPFPNLSLSGLLSLGIFRLLGGEGIFSCWELFAEVLLLAATGVWYPSRPWLEPPRWLLFFPLKVMMM